ncbi:MAG: hypothetical protein IJQ35_09220 [Bacteroidales bacterium]|nr:hypothetical protein [Bacteroidales bacterium]
MEQKGLTKKQFWIQLAPCPLYLLTGIWWVVSGISKKDWLSLILGAAFLVLVVAMVIYSVVQRKRYPLEDPDLDKQVTHNFKEGIKGGGITFLIIGIGFLLAFGLAMLLT